MHLQVLMILAIPLSPLNVRDLVHHAYNFCTAPPNKTPLVLLHCRCEALLRHMHLADPTNLAPV